MCGNPKPKALQQAEINIPENIDFNFHIKPLLADRCFKCHGPDANTRKADLRLDIAQNAYAKVAEKGIAGRVISPGSLGKSEFFHRIISDDPDYMMPPPESNLSLSDEEKALLARWIEQGAEYKKHWAFASPQKPQVPKNANSKWENNPIDAFVLDGIERVRLSPAEEATKEQLLRRISLDLTGLPPSVEELEAFLVDESPDAYENAIDRLLTSPHYGERMAMEWLDVARYADSHGYQDDGMRNTWPWRDWVIKAFNQNLSYDQFLLWQLAGDMLLNPTKDQLLATCFNRNHPQTQEGGVVDEEYRVEYVADRTNTFGKAFIGLTTECARCHDHKYDPISQEEYYSLYAYFNNNNDTGIVPYNGEAAPTIILPTEEAKAELEQLKTAQKPLEEKLLSKNYVDDFKIWLNSQQKTPTIDLNEGLLASFDFEEDKEVPTSIMSLDSPDKNQRARLGPGNAIAYFNDAKNKWDAALHGDVDQKPLIVEGKNGNGISFQGDCGIRFNRDLDFDRHQPFSVSIWVKLLKEGEEGPIFNNTNGDFEGYRGWLCKLNPDGTLSFQLNHVWPDNAIDFQTEEKIEVGKWTHIVMTYDGSSKAKGVRFYIDGKIPKHKLWADNLQKSLLHGVKGTNWSNLPFILGMELRKSIENIVMDELRIYKRKISDLEVQSIFSGENRIEQKLVSSSGEPPEEEQLLEYYLLSGKNEAFNQTLSAITSLRKKENLLITDQLEVMIMQERVERRPTFILDRGVYDAPTEEVTPKTPVIFASNRTYAADRLGLAQWLIDERHPLTARVAVNRFWNMCFGKGLVATQEDFGNQGNLPTHPELLDWLAIDFIENGWNVKAFMKQILMSATYKQSSIPSAEAQKNDPENIYYSHYPAHRLAAETIRDHALASSGLLVKDIGGPSVYPYQPKGIWKALATRNATEYVQQSGDSLYRRGMYTVWKRSSPPPSMMNFDAPDRYYCVVRRQKTSTPLQSLVLMNDPTYVEAARMLAERMMKEGGSNTQNQINFAFKALIGRAAREDELKTLHNLYDLELQDFREDQSRIESILAVGEHPVDKNLDKVKLAANAVIASTIMNFDEFVMKR